MLGVVALLAVLQVYVFDQIDFWGILPMVWLIFIVMFSRTLTWHEMLRWAAIFSAVVTTLGVGNPLLHLLGVLAATFAGVGILAISRRSKFMKKKVFLPALIAVSCFVLVILGVLAVPYVNQVSWLGLARVAAASVIINYGLVSIGLVMSGQQKVAR